MANVHSFCLYIFLTLVFWLPIPLGSNRPWAWAIMAVVSFITLAGLLLATALSKNSKTHLWESLKPYKLLLLPIMLFQVWTLVQLVPMPFAISSNGDLLGELSSNANIISLDPSQGFSSLIKGMSYLCIMVLTIILINTEKHIRLLLKVMLASGLFQACYGVISIYAGLEESLVFEQHISHYATGSFYYKNHFANFLLLTTATSVGLLVANLSKNSGASVKQRLKSFLSAMIKGKAVVRIALAILVIGLVASRSRMGNAAFFVALTITGLYALIYFKNRTPSLSILLVSLFLIDTFILGAWFGVDKVKAHIESTSFAQESRDEVNIYGLTLLKERPIVGYGAGSFYTVFPMVQGEKVTSFYDHAHNDYLQFSLEFGIPATLLLGITVLMSLWQCMQAMRQRNHALMKGVAFGCMTAIIGMLIHISVDFNLQAPANTAYFVIILTLAWQSRNIGQRTKLHSSHN
ncbi:O-antigen ligase family protein [Thalassotalea euphylliae]|uniref:O-antigen ligase family protein n=1 Tax=Thalassotalea euphylliae TaxID=1655234 RepID=A0A3E0U4S2_9GAMM|nr:O-antigen ligase family protein [Thalassotalea euphylliae]REL31936.1 O-antigen ligase family protein [Thalassotalea euphylliae]